MTIGWEDSYTGQLRKMVGHHPLIVPSIRAVINDKQGRTLFLKGKGRGWGMPSGSIELNESITDCLQREVKEETGLKIVSSTLIAIYTSKPIMKNAFGDQNQMFEFLFRVDEWTGKLIKVTDETSDAGFFTLENRPEITDPYWSNHFEQVFNDLKNYNGNLILK